MNLSQLFKCRIALHRLRRTGIFVVNLAALLATLLRPREMRNGDEEEGVAGVRNTGEGVVPGDGG